MYTGISRLVMEQKMEEMRRHASLLNLSTEKKKNRKNSQPLKKSNRISILRSKKAG